MITLIFFLSLALAQVYFENIEEEIRFQEDPYYASYLQEKYKQYEAEKKAQEEQRDISAKSKQEFENNRLQHVAQRDRQKSQKNVYAKRTYQAYQQGITEQKASTEKSRKKFVAQRDQENITRQNIKVKNLAKMQQEVLRLPANYFEITERPRVDKKKRKFR